MSLKLQVIICSTRPGRVGPSVANWFADFAAKHEEFDTTLVDLADFNLPVYDEPQHPRLQDYQHEHTKRWSASVAAAEDRKSTRLNSSHVAISYAVFCLK